MLFSLRQKSCLLHGNFVTLVVEVPSSPTNARYKLVVFLMAPFPLDRLNFHVLLCPAMHRLSLDLRSNEMPLLRAARCTAFISPARCLAKDGTRCTFKSCQMKGDAFEKPQGAVISHQISICELFYCWQWNWSPWRCFFFPFFIRPIFEDIVLGVNSWRVLVQWWRWSPWELQRRSWAKQRRGRMDIQLIVGCAHRFISSIFFVEMVC